MTFTVYPAASGGIFLISMALVCAYGAGMGLESLARFSLWAVVLAVVSLLAFAGGSVSLLRTAHWQGMFSQSAVSVLSRAGSILLRTGETLLFLLLFVRVREQRPAKTAAGGFLFAGIFTSAAALLVIGAVGQYAENLRFPLQTIASAAHFSPQGRMDLLYLFFFVFLVFTRAALWLYGACYCLRHLFPKLRRGMCAVLCGAAAAGLGFLSVLPQVMQWLLSGGVVGLVIVLPLLLLLVRKGVRVS